MARRGAAAVIAVVGASLLTVSVTAQPPAPAFLSVNSSDNALMLQWPAVSSGGGDPLRSYIVTAEPVNIPVIPALNPQPASSEFDGPLDSNSWLVHYGACNRTTLFNAPCRDGSVSASIVANSPIGVLTINVPAGQGSWPLPGFPNNVGLNASSQWGNNGVPLLLRNPATAPVEYRASTSVTYSTRVAISAGQGATPGTNVSSAGFVLYDTPGGGAPRQLFRFYFSFGNPTRTGNGVRHRRLDTSTFGSPAAPPPGAEQTIAGAAGLAPVGESVAELFLIRDAVAGTWTLGFRYETMPFPNFAAAVVRDASIAGGLAGWNASNAFVGLFADNPTVADRTATFERFAVYSESNWKAYAGSVSASLSRNNTIATLGACAVARTVSRVIPADTTTATIGSLLNGVQYTVSVASQGSGALVSARTLAPTVYAPTPVLPALASGSRPALFLDALSLPTGGGKLERWRDVSGNGRDFVQFADALMPFSPNPTAAFPAPAVLFPPATPTEMAMERNDPFFDVATDAFNTSASEFTTISLYQPDAQANYYSMSLLSKGRSGKAGWDVVGLYSGNINFGGFRLYGEDVAFAEYPASAPAPFSQATRAVGLRRTFAGGTINADSYSPTLLTYDYWRSHQVNPQYQVDGCVGVNYGLPSDYCSNPAGDGTVSSTWTSAGTQTISQTNWAREFNWDRSWGPRFPYITGNAVNFTAPVVVSSDPLKISDAYYGGVPTTAGYQQNHFQGRIQAIMLYKPRLSSRAERQQVQEYLLDRYGQRCPPNENPSVNTTCTGFRAAGSNCAQQCVNGTVRVGGPIVTLPAQRATLQCANGVYSSKSLVCARQCPELSGPVNVASCRKAFLAEDFSKYDGNATSVFSLVQYTTAPALPQAAADRRFFFAGGALVGLVPSRDDECSAVTPTTLMTSAPAWAEASVPPADPVVHEAVFSLDSLTARGGIAFRTSANGADVNMYRFSLSVGVAGAVFEKVTGAGTTLATRAFNATDTFTLVPVRGVAYVVACQLRFSSGDISCFVGPSGGDAASRVFAFGTVDNDLLYGGGGLYVEAGQVSFRNWTITGGCGNVGQCRATAGQECRYTCASGYTLSSASAPKQSCNVNGSYTEGGVVECLPTPPQLPGGQVFQIPETAAMSTIMGRINGSAFNPGDVLLWEVLPEGNSEPQRDSSGTAIPGGVNTTGVFGITLCTGELYLAKAGVLSFTYGTRFYFLNLRARVASNPRVTALVTVTVEVLFVRQPPTFPAEAGDARRYTRSITENSPVGTLVTPPIAATAVGTQVATYSILFGNDDGTWRINNATGQLEVAVARLDFETMPRYQLMVGAADVVTPDEKSTVLVDVNLLDVNDPPVAVNQELFITETQAKLSLTEVGVPVVTDADVGDSLSWTIQGGNTTFFGIGNLNGSIFVTTPPFVNNQTVVSGGTPTRQCRGSYFLQLSVTDAKSPTFTVFFNVTIWITVSEQTETGGSGPPPPQLLTLEVPPAGFNTTGGNSFEVTGANFVAASAPFRTVFTAGTGTAARYYISPPCTVTPDGTFSRMQCVSPPGWGPALLGVLVYGPLRVGNPVQRSYNGTVAAGSVPVRYAAPIIIRARSNGTDDLQNLTTRGNQWVYLDVLNLAHEYYSPVFQLKYGIQTPTAALMLYPTTTVYYTLTGTCSGFANCRRLYKDVSLTAEGYQRIWFKTVPGIGARHSIRLETGGYTIITNVSGLDQPSISYGPPVITNVVKNVSVVAVSGLINWDAMRVQGGTTFHVIGSNFGASGTVVRGYFGGNQTIAWNSDSGTRDIVYDLQMTCTITVAHVRMSCVTPAGTGANLRFQISVDGQSSGFWPEFTMSYVAPTVTGISGVGATNANTVGGQIVTIAGRNFGPTVLATSGGAAGIRATPVYARYGRRTDTNESLWNATGCTVTEWTATTTAGTVICTTGPGSGRALVWRMWVGGQWATFATNATTSYAAPVVADFAVVTPGRPSNVVSFDSRGSTLADAGLPVEEVDLIGRNFGPELRDFSASYTFELQSRDTEWPAIKLAPPAALANGTTPITYAPRSCYMVEPHLRIRCQLGEGVGGGAEWRISLNGQNSSTPTMGHPAPEIYYVRNASDPSQSVTQASSDGGDTLVLIGKNFGPGSNRSVNCRAPAPTYLLGAPWVRRCFGYMQAVKFGPFGVEFPSTSNVAVYNDTHIYVQLPAGFGAQLRFTVTIAEQNSAPSIENFTYAKPYVTAVSPTLINTAVNVPDSDATSASTYQVLRVSGFNFGLLDALQAQGVFVGNPADGSESEMLAPFNVYPQPSQWSAYRALAVKPPQWLEVLVPQGLLAGRAVRVVIFPNGQGPESPAAISTDPDVDRVFFSYRPPTLSSVVLTAIEESDPTAVDFVETQLANCNDAPAYKLTLTGANLGPSQAITGDSIVRAVEHKPFADTPADEWDDTKVKVFSWSHTTIVGYTCVNEGTLQVKRSGLAFNGTWPIVETSPIVRRFRRLSPTVRGWGDDNRGPFPATGSTASAPIFIKINVTELAEEATINVTVGGLPCPLYKDNPSEGLLPTDPVALQAILQGTTTNPYRGQIGTVIYWRLTCMLPPGQGSNAALVVNRGNFPSPIFRVPYALPTVSTVEVWDDERPTPGWGLPLSIVDASSTVYVPTEPTRVRITGANFGLSPIVAPGAVRRARSNPDKFIALCNVGPVAEYFPGFDAGAGANSSGPAAPYCTPVTQADALATFTSLEFTTFLGAGTGLPAVPTTGYLLDVAVGNQQLPFPVLFRHLPPSLRSWTTTGSTTGGSRFTVTGRNFGGPTSNVTGLSVIIGRTTGDYAPGLLPCTDVAYDEVFGVQAGQRQLSCTLPEGAGAGLHVWVQVSDLLGNTTTGTPAATTAAFSYAAPNISFVQLGDGPVLPAPSIEPSPSASPSLEGTPSSSPSVSATSSAAATSSPEVAATTESPSSAPSPPPIRRRQLQATESASPSFGASSSPEPTPSPSSAGSPEPSPSHTPTPSAGSGIRRPEPDSRLGGAASIAGLPASGLQGEARMAITVFGSNFGRSTNGSTCMFFAWYGRTVRTLVCDGLASAVGEGEVPPVAVLNWDHDRITFLLPPGAGLREIVPFVWGQVPATPIVAVYDPPRITGELSPVKGNTDGGTEITISGVNFGRQPINVLDAADRDTYLGRPLASTLETWLVSEPLRLPQEIMRVNFARLCFSRYNDSQGFRPSVLFACGTDAVKRQADNSITFTGPPGIGLNRSVTVTIMDRLPSGSFVEFTSNAVNFSYLPPKVLDVQPRPVPMDGKTSKTVTMRGENFGRVDGTADAWTPAELAVTVIVGLNTPCDDAERFEDPRSGQVLLRCQLPSVAVGPKNISYTVAGQTGNNYATDGTATVFTSCEGASPSTYKAARVPAAKGTYGRDGEMCYPCPTGAFCGGFLEGVTLDAISVRDGGLHSYPRPLEWWFNLNGTCVYNGTGTNECTQDPMFLECPPVFKSKALDVERSVPGQEPVYRDVCIVPCEPKEACVGDNLCALGYTSKAPYYRCASCADKFYKRANECIKCPDSPAMLFVGAAFLLIIGAAGAYVLNKKKINIGYISIGMDFFQVLAMFGNSKVKWPAAIKELFHILSAFNLNIEIVAPECLVPNLAFENKWAFIMALPVGIMGVFFVVHTTYFMYKKQVKGRKGSFVGGAGQLISSVTMLMYIMYIYLTRSVLDVFNCAPTDPDDGKRYLQVVFEDCDKPGSAHKKLYAVAVIALLGYVLGYPAAIARILYTKRELIMEDQLLRAKGVGNDRLSNPRAYDMRKTFRNIYYQFKPDYVFWALVIILRKFLLALTLIMFNRNSSFQLAAALLIMFCAYAAQVKTVPYMSPADMEQTLKDHERSAAEGSAIHIKLRAAIGKVESRGRKKVHRNVMTPDGKLDRSAVLGMLSSWLFNYNTTEALLLFACVIVALMGLMFAALPERDFSAATTESRDAITSVALATIILGVLYFFFVVIGEIYLQYTEGERVKAAERRAAALRKKGDYTKGDKAGRSSDTRRKDMAAAASMMSAGEMLQMAGPVEASLNPLFMDGGGQSAAGVQEAIMAQTDVPSQELWRLFQASFMGVQEEIARAAHSVAECKVAQQKLEAAAALLEESAAGRRPARLGEGDRPQSMRAKKKSEFTPGPSRRDLGGSGGSGGGRGGEEEDGPPGSPSLRAGAGRAAPGGVGRPASLQSLKGLKK